MNETKFTKGEWKIFDERVGIIDTSDTQSYGMMNEVAFIDMYNFEKSECIANIHLIKTAPKLYYFIAGLYESMCLNGRVIELGEEDCQEIGQLLTEARGE